MPRSDWSGRDHQDRIIYTVGGKLFRMEKYDAVELADFTDRKPDPQLPPEFAKKDL